MSDCTECWKLRAAGFGAEAKCYPCLLYAANEEIKQLKADRALDASIECEYCRGCEHCGRGRVQRD